MRFFFILQKGRELITGPSVLIANTHLFLFGSIWKTDEYLFMLAMRVLKFPEDIEK
jgi:hypothetical protein